MKNNTITKLINEAKDIANANFCCKHSNFTVGVALLTKDGKVYTLPVTYNMLSEGNGGLWIE